MIAFTLALMLAQAQPLTSTGPWHLHGAGLESCGDWLIHKDDEAYRIGELGWAAGFLSGVNLAAGGKATEVDVSSFVAHIDQQCTARPLERVAGVAVEFFVDLRSRTR